MIQARTPATNLVLCPDTARRIKGLGLNETIHTTHRATAEACARHIAQALQSHDHTDQGPWHEQLETAAREFELLFDSTTS
jgi:hypothetical protein